MDFIRDFAGLFCLSVGGNMAGQAAGQLLAKKIVAAIVMLLATAGTVALGYYVAIDQTTTMFQIAAALFALSFFFGWKNKHG